MSDFVPLDSLLGSKEFLSKVTQANPDPNYLRRMDNDICRKCHQEFARKYPGKQFDIECNGIYDQSDYQEMQEQYAKDNPGETISIDEIQEIYDTVYWAEKYIRVTDKDGDFQPFVARWYQNEVMRCSARRKVDRMGRGLGKSITGIIIELHKAMTRKNYPILVVCPAQAQSEYWYQNILLQIENSPALRDSLVQKKQQPFQFFKFNNGSTISIFTAGSKSGRGADSIRSQNPHRVRLDEQDYLAEKDWAAIQPLMRRFPDSEFHGASTPSGKREMFWSMCTQLSQYREFYFPIMVHPDWGPEKEQECIAEAKTMDRYRHEYLAEFGDPEQGVFKGIFVDKAKRVRYRYSECVYTSSRKYFMGVDWNGRGTGTKIYVVEYDPDTQIRKVVAIRSVDEVDATTRSSLLAIRDLNRQWRCESIFIDYGFGAVQDEMLRAMGAQSTHALDKRLMDVKVIDFGATLETNALVSRREYERDSGGRRKAKGRTDHLNEEGKLERRTKPFMVDGAVQAFESEKVLFSPEDGVMLEEQLRAYRVKTYSMHGYANVYEAGEIGDHELDALMLALLACEMKFGLYRTGSEIKRLAQIFHVGSFGVGTVSPNPNEIVSSPTETRRRIAGIPSRAEPHQNRDAWRLQYLIRNSAPLTGGTGRLGGVFAPPEKPQRSPRGGPGSRTAMFRNPGKNRFPF